MIDYSKWPRKNFLITTLKLDDKNPRLPGTTNNIQTQPQIINYLIEHENVFLLAKSIASKGYLPNEEPIVCKEGNKYVVLEGNRRVAACKILINPDLIKSSSKRKVIVNLVGSFDIKFISKATVIVSPDRESADIIIVNRHTDGTSIEKWDKTKQDRFFHNRFLDGETVEVLSSKFNVTKAGVKDSIARYNMYQELLKLDITDVEKKEVEDETKFSMTNIERFYKSKLGKDFLGIDFDKDSSVKHRLPKIEYSARLKRIVLDAIKGTLNSRTYGDEKLQGIYIENLKSDTAFKMSTVLDEKEYEKEYRGIEESTVIDDEEQTPATEESSTTVIKVAAKNKLMPSDLKWKIGIKRIDKIFVELKAADLKTQFNGAAVLFRSYLDMVVYQYMVKNDSIKDFIIKEQQKLDADNEKKLKALSKYIQALGVVEDKIRTDDLKKLLNLRKISKEWVPTLKQMLTHLVQSPDLITDAKLRQALGSYVKGNDGFLDHNDYNLLVHNEYFIKDGADLKKSWDQLFPILDYIYKQFSI